MKKTVSVIFFLFFKICLSYAAEWGVAPIKLELDATTLSSSITVTNDDDKPINFVLKEKEWLQDEEGKDIYRESQDLIFFPKSFRLEGKSQRVIRVGLKKPSLSEQKAYRLYIEEIPTSTLEGKSFVSIAVRFGVPVFSLPAPQNINATMDIEGSKGKLAIIFKNEGNRYIKVETINVNLQDGDGKSVGNKHIAGWYVFPRVKRKFNLSLSEEECLNTKKIAVTAISENKEFKVSYDISEALCN